jgi:hypothetical protein
MAYNAPALEHHVMHALSWYFSFSWFISRFLAKQCEPNIECRLNPKFIGKQERIDRKCKSRQQETMGQESQRHFRSCF